MPSNDPVIYVPNGLNWLYNFLLVCICIQSSKGSVSKMNLSKNKKSIIRIVLKILLYVSLLFLFSYFYMKDQMLAFLNRRTTKTNREEKARVLEFPTTTICFNPGTKLSVSKRYQFESNDDKFTKDVANQSLGDTYDSLSYQLGADFEIQESNSGKGLKLGYNEIRNMKESWNSVNEQTSTFIFELRAVRTYSFGTCYQLEPHFDVTSVPTRFKLKISLKKSNDQPESINLRFTSNKTDVLVIDNMAPQFRILPHVIPFNTELTKLYFKVVEKYFEHGVEDSKDCVKRLYSAGNCSRHCGLLSLTDLPICPSTEQLNCVWGQAMLDGGDNFTNCLMTKHATTYDLITKVIEPYHHDPNLSTTEIIIGLWTMQILKEERVPVLTFEDLIGSVGGSLGMFFGFSISSIIVSCINKIL